MTSGLEKLLAAEETPARMVESREVCRKAIYELIELAAPPVVSEDRRKPQTAPVHSDFLACLREPYKAALLAPKFAKHPGAEIPALLVAEKGFDGLPHGCGAIPLYGLPRYLVGQLDFPLDPFSPGPRL